MFFFADLWNLQESAIIFDWDDTLFPTWHRYGMRCVADIMWTQDDERPSLNYYIIGRFRYIAVYSWLLSRFYMILEYIGINYMIYSIFNII